MGLIASVLGSVIILVLAIRGYFAFRTDRKRRAVKKDSPAE